VAFFHALASGDSDTFCKLWDPASLKALLAEKHISTCDRIGFTSASDQGEFKAYKIKDPSQIIVVSSTALIPGSAVAPADFGSVDLKKDATDGQWKVDIPA